MLQFSPMHISQRTDYALRILIYLGLHPDERIRLNDIALAYDISYYHLVKIVKMLHHRDIVDPKRGKNGGLMLNKDPSEINVGYIVEEFEPHMNILECFDCAHSHCPITPVCAGRDVFFQARKAFMDVLYTYTLADCLAKPEALLALFKSHLRLNT